MTHIYFLKCNRTEFFDKYNKILEFLHKELCIRETFDGRQNFEIFVKVLRKFRTIFINCKESKEKRILRRIENIFIFLSSLRDNNEIYIVTGLNERSIDRYKSANVSRKKKTDGDNLF